jgi:hypothetical protein
MDEAHRAKGFKAMAMTDVGVLIRISDRQSSNPRLILRRPPASNIISVGAGHVRKAEDPMAVTDAGLSIQINDT